LQQREQGGLDREVFSVLMDYEIFNMKRAARLCSGPRKVHIKKQSRLGEVEKYARCRNAKKDCAPLKSAYW
jgi:hypothetical protein